MSGLILPEGWDRGSTHEKDESRNAGFKEIPESEMNTDTQVFLRQRRLSELEEFLEDFGNREDDPTGEIAEEIRDGIKEEMKIIHEEIKVLRGEK